MEIIMEHIMASTQKDEERFRKIIDEAIEKSGELKRLPKYKPLTKREKERKRKKAEKEAKEAKKLRKDLKISDSDSDQDLNVENGKSSEDDLVKQIIQRKKKAATDYLMNISKMEEKYCKNTKIQEEPSETEFLEIKKKT